MILDWPLILIGRLLETRTKEKESNSVRKLLDLQPKMAKVLREGEVEVEQRFYFHKRKALVPIFVNEP